MEEKTYFTEQHVISRSNLKWKTLDDLCFMSKNLYNYCLYKINHTYTGHGKFLRYIDLEKILRKEEKHEAYFALPAQTAQQTIKLLDKNVKSYFGLLRIWKKDKKSLSGCPHFPKYKHKTKGRNIVIFTNQQCKLKNGFIVFPKRTNLKPLRTKITIGLQEIRIIPNSSCYTIEVIHKKERTEHADLDQNKHMGIDIGVNNLCAITFDQPGLRPILVNGRPLKSMNQFYNKNKAELQSYLKGNGRTSNKIKRLTLKHHCKVKNYLHHVSKYILNLCLKHKIGSVVVGYNEGWKTGINIGKRNNQNFCSIPFDTLLNQISYKLGLNGISLKTNNENYTSKTSSLDKETISKHDEYIGKRIHRGLLKGSNFLSNADVNGSLNILRKEIGDGFIDLLDRGFVLNPLKVEPLKTA